MKFRTKYDKTPEISTRAGERIKPEYQLVVNDFGVEDLELVGGTDLQASINSHKDSVDINLIMARVKNGETDLLDRAKGFYGDVTDLPCNLQDALNLSLRGEQFYESLPVEIRDMFSSYVDMVNNPEKLIDALSPKPEKKEESEKVEPDVKSGDTGE